MINPRPVVVVDASAVAAMLFGEPEAQVVADRLEDSALVAPALLPFEVASVCLKKLAQHPDQRVAILQALGLFERLSVQLADVDHGAAIALARRHDLSTYDASYLWLAQALRARLETLDARLAGAAE